MPLQMYVHKQCHCCWCTANTTTICYTMKSGASTLTRPHHPWYIRHSPATTPMSCAPLCPLRAPSPSPPPSQLIYNMDNCARLWL